MRFCAQNQPETRIRRAGSMLLILSLLAATAPAIADPPPAFEINWWSIDNGGAAPASASTPPPAFSISGVIGQFDAIAPPAPGTGFTLSGGFCTPDDASTPYCPADFNNSGSITVQDLFDFLSAWFASNPRADFNHSGSITVQDIFAFLSAWFAGCP